MLIGLIVAGVSTAALSHWVIKVDRAHKVRNTHDLVYAASGALFWLTIACAAVVAIL